DRMPDEMLLFYQLVTRARRRLTLSYPAVDERGQALLPSSFLSALLVCFTPDAVPVERRSMLIERYDREPPRSPAESRVRLAAALRGKLAEGKAAVPLPPDLAANLARAALVARQRSHAKEFTPYDGLFRDGAARAELAQVFKPEKVLSPTALE